MSTKIEWIDETWTPIRARNRETAVIGWHCERVSDGCTACYAERLNQKRFGTGLPYNRKSRDLVDVYLDEDVLVKPLHWKKPRKVFPCSMTDMFGEWVERQWLIEMYAVMVVAYWHIFQPLTKRPERRRELLTDPEFREAVARRARELILNTMRAGQSFAAEIALERWEKGQPPSNIWEGTSVENQREADRRIPELLATPAAVRFLSCEPLLGPVELNDYLHDEECLRMASWPPSGLCICPSVREGQALHWVIVGGESGPGARPCDVGWIRSIVQQCQGAGTAVFVKQLGSKPRVAPDEDVDDWPIGTRWLSWSHSDELCGPWLRDRKGGDMSEFPEDLRVREFPGEAL